MILHEVESSSHCLDDKQQDEVLMKLFALLTIVAIVLTLSGCVPPGGQRAQYPNAPAKTQAQIERDRIFEQFKYAFEQASKCATELLERNEEARVMSQQILYVSDTSPYKLELMASTKKISPAQREIIKRVYPEMMKCRQANMKNLAGSPFYPAIADSNNRGDGIFLKLLSGEMTIGEANKLRANGVEQVRQDITRIQNNLNTNYQAAHNREAADRQQNTQRMHEYLMQQQRIQSQEQMQRSQQNILLNPPTPSPSPMPTRTNCFTSRDGYTTCTTN